jgi:hypothetical protein
MRGRSYQSSLRHRLAREGCNVAEAVVEVTAAHFYRAHRATW